MIALEAALQNLEAYPRWLVALGAIVAAAAAVWILAKVLKWAIYLAALVTFGCVVVVALAWWLA